MIPVTKSNTPNNYYIVNKARKISLWIKALRFIIRYIVPMLILSSIIADVNVFLINKMHFEKIDRYLFIVVMLGLGLIVIILSNLWFRYISKIQDKSQTK